MGFLSDVNLSVMFQKLLIKNNMNWFQLVCVNNHNLLINFQHKNKHGQTRGGGGGPAPKRGANLHTIWPFYFENCKKNWNVSCRNVACLLQPLSQMRQGLWTMDASSVLQPWCMNIIIAYLTDVHCEFLKKMKKIWINVPTCKPFKLGNNFQSGCRDVCDICRFFKGKPL